MLPLMLNVTPVRVGVYLLCVPLQLCGVLCNQGRQSALQGLDDGDSALQLFTVAPHPLLDLHLKQRVNIPVVNITTAQKVNGAISSLSCLSQHKRHHVHLPPPVLLLHFAPG